VGVGPHAHKERMLGIPDGYNRRMSKTVAVVGASNNRSKFGNKALRAFRNQGYTVIPINPTEREVEGHRTYASVLDVPGEIDLATIYVPGNIGLAVMEELAQKRIAEVWLNPGADDPAVVARARQLGLTTVRQCSILAIGESPSRY
jgi:predicted CoA-binding protein